MPSATKTRPKPCALEEQYEAGLNDPYLLNMVIRQFKILLQVRQALEKGLSSRQMMSALKLHPFVIQKSLAQVKAFSLDELKKQFSHLIEIDSRMKQGQANIKLELDLMLSGLS